jgi:hypothetical protein
MINFIWSPSVPAPYTPPPLAERKKERNFLLASCYRSIGANRLPPSCASSPRTLILPPRRRSARLRGGSVSSSSALRHWLGLWNPSELAFTGSFQQIPRLWPRKLGADYTSVANFKQNLCWFPSCNSMTTQIAELDKIKYQFRILCLNIDIQMYPIRNPESSHSIFLSSRNSVKTTRKKEGIH